MKRMAIRGLAGVVVVSAALCGCQNNRSARQSPDMGYPGQPYPQTTQAYPQTNSTTGASAGGLGNVPGSGATGSPMMAGSPSMSGSNPSGTFSGQSSVGVAGAPGYGFPTPPAAPSTTTWTATGSTTGTVPSTGATTAPGSLLPASPPATTGTPMPNSTSGSTSFDRPSYQSQTTIPPSTPPATGVPAMSSSTDQLR